MSSATPRQPVRLAVRPAGVPAPAGPYSPGVVVGELLFISGQGPFDETGTVVAGGFDEEVRAAFENLARIAAAAGGDLRNAVRIGGYIKDYDGFARYNEIMREYVGEPLPARTTIPVPTLPISIELDAVVAL
jgi:reactive intermediate/imine deaminase